MKKDLFKKPILFQILKGGDQKYTHDPYIIGIYGNHGPMHIYLGASPIEFGFSNHAWNHMDFAANIQNSQ